ncbi:MAG TPA: hypothetical protein VGL89_00805 [Candidatus Koribacter sp.]|jgi:hypothetical protein
MIAMLPAVHRFIEAHDRFLALDQARFDFNSAHERELYHIEMMKAYLEVQYRAKVIAGIQYADGMDFADCH